MPKSLDQLGEIDWQAAGNKEMPRWLSEVISPDRYVAQRACELIEEHTTRRGTESVEDFAPIEAFFADDIPILIVPFVIGLIETPKPHYTMWTFNFLIDLLDVIDHYLPNLEEPYKTKAKQLVKAVASGEDVYYRVYEMPEAPQYEIAHLVQAIKKLKKAFRQKKPS
jgi:hypothetical protein